MSSKKPVIGRRELFALPKLGLKNLVGKIDSGAHTTSLHAAEITPFHLHNDLWVRFRTVDDLICEAPVERTKRVRSSNGGVSERYFIKASLRTKDHRSHATLITLADRSKMACPMLIGRRYLRYYLIDCGRQFVLGK